MASELVSGRKAPPLLYHPTQPEGGKESRGHTCRVREGGRESGMDAYIERKKCRWSWDGSENICAAADLCMVHARMPRQDSADGENETSCQVLCE
jgi:hypothetical protein